MKKALAIDIGGTKINIGLFEKEGKKLENKGFSRKILL